MQELGKDIIGIDCLAHVLRSDVDHGYYFLLIEVELLIVKV